MAVYLLIFVILSGVALLMEARLTRNLRLALIAFGYMLLVLFVGLRWETGNDWFNYYNYYSHLETLRYHSDPAVSGYYEIGYRVVNLVFRKIGLPYTGFLLAYSAVYLGLITLSFDEDDFRMGGWLLLLFYSSFLISWMGTSREIMAIGICIFSIRYLVSKKWAKFLLCVALAACFHTTALCFLLAWPLARFRLTLRSTWIVMGLLAVASAFNVGALLVKAAGNGLGVAYFDTKLAIYSDPTGMFGAPGQYAMLFYFKRLSFLLLFILCFRCFTEERDKLYFKLYLMSVIIFVLLYGAYPVIPMLAGIYFGIVELFLLALLTCRLKSRWQRSLYCGALLLLCFARMLTAVYVNTPKTLVPYKGVIINQDVWRDEGWFE